MKYLVVEQKEVSGHTETRIVLNFEGPRQGVASWLAPPSAMGTLDFVSPDAAFVSAFTIKNPAAILEELLAKIPKLRQELAEAESKLGVNLAMDLAGSFGGDFAISMDGPALPIPSWKLAAEVYDPARLQHAIAELVEAARRDAKDGPGIELTEEKSGAWTYYTISVPGAEKFREVHYVFVDGYLVAGPSRALLDRTLQYRETGYTLTHSEQFRSLLPQDRYTDFSGLVYQNLGATVGPLVQGFSAGKNVTPEQRSFLEALSTEMKPMLFTLYGEENRITVASTGNLFGLGLSKLMGLPDVGFGALLSGRAPRVRQGSDLRR